MAQSIFYLLFRRLQKDWYSGHSNTTRGDMDCLILRTERIVKIKKRIWWPSERAVYTPPRSGSVPCHFRSLTAAVPAIVWREHMPAQVLADSGCWREVCAGTLETPSPFPPKTKPVARAAAGWVCELPAGGGLCAGAALPHRSTAAAGGIGIARSRRRPRAGRGPSTPESCSYSGQRNPQLCGFRGATSNPHLRPRTPEISHPRRSANSPTCCTVGYPTPERAPPLPGRSESRLPRAGQPGRSPGLAPAGHVPLQGHHLARHAGHGAAARPAARRASRRARSAASAWPRGAPGPGEGRRGGRARVGGWRGPAPAPRTPARPPAATPAAAPVPARPTGLGRHRLTKRAFWCTVGSGPAKDASSSGLMALFNRKTAQSLLYPLQWPTALLPQLAQGAMQSLPSSLPTLRSGKGRRGAPGTQSPAKLHDTSGAALALPSHTFTMDRCLAGLAKPLNLIPSCSRGLKGLCCSWPPSSDPLQRELFFP